MDPQIVLSALAIVALLLISAFFSSSETALTAASRARIHRLSHEGSRRAMLVRKLINNKESLIGAILLGNNLVNILASALATQLFINLFGEAGVVYATIVMTALIVIFAEVMPKTYAISNPDRMSLSVAPYVDLFLRTLGPIVVGVQRLVRLFLRMLGIDIGVQQNVLSAQEEIRGVVELHASEGTLIKAHRDMVGSILDLDEIHLEDVMIHRRAMVMIDGNQPPEKIVEHVATSSYTRLPLWKDNPDNIIGILNAKDVLRAVHAHGGNVSKINIEAIAAKPWFVPETTSLREQMNAFRERRAHFALVVDEYGAIMGIITLEDILEEIVGEISDEHDAKVAGIRRWADGSVVVDGILPIRDINREMDWPLPDEEATTIAGLVLHIAERIPRPGESFKTDGFTLEVLRRHRNQITAVRIMPPADDSVE